jgi:hypothetical protein
MDYLSGEEIRAGDHVLWHGDPGRVEFVTNAEGPESRWFFDQFGGGCMLIVETAGRVFEPEADEDLDFVSRGSH